MHWVWRPGSIDDLEVCIPLLAPFRPIYGEDGWATISDFLRFLIANHAVDFATCRNAAIKAEPIIAFDTFVFVSDEFVDQTLSGPPFLLRRLLSCFREDNLPILTPRGAYEAHKGQGLHLLHLFTAMAPDAIDPTEPFLLLDAAVESITKRMRGLNCRRVLGEAFGPHFKQWCLSGGYSMGNDYAEYFQTHPDECPPEALRPILMTATAEDARRNFGSRIAPVFRHARPVLGFSPSERSMLQFALHGDTDEDLAQRLGISVWTVKKRWRQVYDRVESKMPELLSAAPRDCPEDEKGRGTEHRRHLLAFLRDHFEELCMVDQWPKLGPAGETLRR